MKTSVTPDVHVETHGAITKEEEDYLRVRIGDVLRFAPQPALHARAKLTRYADPALSRPAMAQVNVDLNGRFLRAQAARPTMREAIDEVRDRLRDRLQRSSGNWESIRGSQPVDGPHQWRHGAPRTERPDHFPRPLAERRIVKHRTLSMVRQTVEEAIVDMSMLDFSFYLFTEAHTGADSVLCREPSGDGWLLLQTEPRPGEVPTGETLVRVEPLPAPELCVSDAVDRLNLAGWPFVFFRDLGTGRGCVLYCRYDGHYGLISPATD
jgi:hypothetical protein